MSLKTDLIENPQSSPDFDKLTPQATPVSSPDFDKLTPQKTPAISRERSSFAPAWDSVPRLRRSPSDPKGIYAPHTPLYNLYEKQMIFNPYYGKNIELYGNKNCGRNRPSIKKYPKEVKKYLSKMCDVIPFETIEFIIGPISYSEYEYNGMTIFLFGEQHTINNSECIDHHPKNTVSMYTFLESVINEHPEVFYDVFLEIDRAMVVPEDGMKAEIIPDYVNYWKMANTTSTFMKCMINQEECPYENARIHYADIRSAFGAHETSIFEGVPRDIIPFFIKTMYTNNKRIMKEIGKSYLGTVILKYLELIIESYVEDDTLTALERDSVITAIIMDMYLLSRVFKVFAPSSVPEGISRERSAPEGISNAIIYVGETHAEHYRDFFEFVLNLTPKIKYIDANIEDTNSCLDVTSFRGSKLF